MKSIIIKSFLVISEIISEALVNSTSPMTETSEVSLISEANCAIQEGKDFASTTGRTMYLIVCKVENPKDFASQICCRSIFSIPLLTISAIYALVNKVKDIYAVCISTEFNPK